MDSRRRVGLHRCRYRAALAGLQHPNSTTPKAPHTSRCGLVHRGSSNAMYTTNSIGVRSHDFLYSREAIAPSSFPHLDPRDDRHIELKIPKSW